MNQEFIIPDSDEVRHTKEFKEVQSKINGLNQSQVNELRRMCKYDKFFLAHGILGYKKLSQKLHNELCKWLEINENEQYREILLGRSHYKSTIATITDSIQLALPDDVGVKKYPYNLGSEIRILLSHNVAEKAEEFLYAITMHFMTNPWIMGLYPELVPNQRVQKINQKTLGLPRKLISTQQTFSAMGVGGKNQGAHYNFIKCDDLYGEAERASAAERTSTIQWVDNLQSYLDTPATDHIDFIGTRWAFDDIYDHIHKVYGDDLKKFIRGSEVIDPESGLKVPIFPQQTNIIEGKEVLSGFTTKSFEILKKNKIVWNAQYANDPKEGAARFQEVWLRYYNRPTFKSLMVLNGKESYRVEIDSLDKIIIIDPATKGLSGIVVTGTDRKGNAYILEAKKKSWTPEQLTEEVFQLVQRYAPRIVVIEEVLFSILFMHWWEKEMRTRNIKFKIEGAKTKGRDKEDRVMALSPFFSAGQIYINRDFEDFITEFKEFGATENYHMLDALAYGPKYWRMAVDIKKLDNNTQLNKLVDFYSY